MAGKEVAGKACLPSGPLPLLTILAAQVVLFFSCSSPVLFVAHVYDAETGRPLPGALVTIEPTGMMAAVDSTGRTPIAAACPNARLGVASKGYRPAAFVLTTPVHRNDTVLIDAGIYPDLPRIVQGRVIKAGSRTGCYPAVITTGSPETVVAVEPDGCYLLTDFPPGPQTVTASCSGFAAQTRIVQAKGGDTTRLDFFLHDTTDVGELDGTVLDATTGTPVSGALVAIEQTGRSTMSDSAGHYSFSQVPAGEHRITGHADGYREKTIPFRMVKGWAVTVDFELVPAQGTGNQGPRP